MSMEGGFQGRTAKLADGCYSFWMGATLAILKAQGYSNESCLFKGSSLFSEEALSNFILICCQEPTGSGGLLDKPGE